MILARAAIKEDLIKIVPSKKGKIEDIEIQTQDRGKSLNEMEKIQELLKEKNKRELIC